MYTVKLLTEVEIEITESQVASLALKLENIIEVFSVEAVKNHQVICLRAAYVKMDKQFLETPRAGALQKHGAVIVNWWRGCCRRVVGFGCWRVITAVTKQRHEENNSS